MVQHTGINDFLLAMLLLYLTVDMHRSSEAFQSCNQPVRSWLLGTYAIVICLRCAWLAADTPLRVGLWKEFDCLSPSGAWTQLLWTLLMLWIVLGTVWTWRGRAQSKLCLGEPRHFLLAVSWIAIGHTWLLFHAWIAIMRWQHDIHVKWVKDNIRAVEDEDLVSRWGAVSERAEEACLSHGLTAAEISALPSETVSLTSMSQDKDHDCPICLCALRPGDTIRPLHSCGHTFHRACIDLWLLRRADCPLCKTHVGAGGFTRGLQWNV